MKKRNLIILVILLLVIIGITSVFFIKKTYKSDNNSKYIQDRIALLDKKDKLYNSKKRSYNFIWKIK